MSGNCCPFNTYLIDTTCKACDDSCATCSGTGVDKCTGCRKFLKPESGKCVYDDTQTEYIACADGYTRYGKKCIINDTFNTDCELAKELDAAFEEVVEEETIEEIVAEINSFDPCSTVTVGGDVPEGCMVS